MTTVGELFDAARQHIVPAEARLLLAHRLGKNLAWLVAHRDDPVAATMADDYLACVRRRAAGEPVAYLTGVREFYGRPFLVTPDVLIPRPETELLVDIALAKLGAGRAARLLDLGTGSGCLAVTLALEMAPAKVLAVDLSPAALAVAGRNARQLGAPVDFLASDWFAALPAQRFDFIVANPPYIAAGDAHLAAGDLRFEPADALTDHADGLAAIRRIVAEAVHWLEEGGWLFIEHGHDQAAAVRQLFEAGGFAAIEQHADLAGIVRASGGSRAARQAGSASIVFPANNQ